ncbi:MAG: hypothetical protein HKN33_15285 [Pyrinomonadaceae bacterium]|nr:hypothetical protein [Pyrinomonadaceae bacterium]
MNLRHLAISKGFSPNDQHFDYCLLCLVFLPASARAGRQLAVTIDDLPVVTSIKSKGIHQSITRRLLGHIKNSQTPVIAFVNEKKLYSNGELNENAVELLRNWLRAGCDQGNQYRTV